MFNFFKKKEENNENKAQNTGFGLLKNALSKTAGSLIDNVVGVVTGDKILDEFELEDVEDYYTYYVLILVYLYITRSYNINTVNRFYMLKRYYSILLILII